MRPLHAEDTLASRQRGRTARRDEQDTHHGVPLASSNHMSFVVADEAAIDSYLEQPALPSPFRDHRKSTEPPRKEDNDHARDDVPPSSPFSRASPVLQSPASLTSQAQPTASRPMTPMMLGTSCVGSAGSDTSSRRHSITSSISDPGIATDHEQDDHRLTGDLPSTLLESDSVPQLIMPSIKMPSRRPFTETGKNYGRLKILLAGPSGIGKTSLLKAIVQTCDHIVHVDPIAPSRETRPGFPRPAVASESPRGSRSTTTITEVYASTKPYPEWWQELDIPRTSHRRKSLGDSVLERNICFVDTPGYSHGLSAMEAIMPCVDYVESHFSKISSDDLSDSDLMNMLGGGGGCQVDVVLYLISHKALKPADLEYIRRLTLLTNVIPVLAHAELLSEMETAACKQKVAAELQKAGIRPFSFTPATALGPHAEAAPSIPYTVSSAMISEHEIMDASLLMSPDYVQPLMPTELSFLVERIFSLDGASWLRHSAAKKYLQWREQTPRGASHLYRRLTFPEPSNMPAAGHASLALARIPRPRHSAHHVAPRLHLADWAADLQRSQAAERRQYEALLRGERAVWLTEKLHECVQDGTLVAVRRTDEPTTHERRGKESTSGRRSRGLKTRRHQDPLGLLQVAADLRAKGWVALEVVGTLGVAGLLVWISHHTWPLEAAGWAGRWTDLFGD